MIALPRLAVSTFKIETPVRVFHYEGVRWCRKHLAGQWIAAFRGFRHAGSIGLTNGRLTIGKHVIDLGRDLTSHALRKLIREVAQDAQRLVASGKDGTLAKASCVEIAKRSIQRIAAARMIGEQRFMHPGMERTILVHRVHQSHGEGAQIAIEREPFSIQRKPAQPGSPLDAGEDPPCLTPPDSLLAIAIDERNNDRFEHPCRQDRTCERGDHIGPDSRVRDMRYDPPHQVDLRAMAIDLRQGMSGADVSQNIGIACLQGIGGYPQEKRVARHRLGCGLTKPSV